MRPRTSPESHECDKIGGQISSKNIENLARMLTNNRSNKRHIVRNVAKQYTIYACLEYQVSYVCPVKRAREMMARHKDITLSWNTIKYILHDYHPLSMSDNLGTLHYQGFAHDEICF